MNTLGTITEMGYVAIRTRDMGASLKSAADILGLQEMESTGQKAMLTAAGSQPEMVYLNGDEDGVDHLGLVAADEEHLAAVRDNVERGGWKIIAEQPIEDYAEAGFAFVGPEGYTWHIYTRQTPQDVRLGGFGPDRFGHINIKAVDTIGMRNFLNDTFGFRVSDQIGEDVGFFMRCNPDHHGIAIVKGDRTGLHHHAWQTQSIADLGKLGDRLARSGSRLLWGPVRHGAGHNIAAYYVEPTGNVIELYTDMEQIYDHEREANYWAEEDLCWINQWDGYVPASVPTLGVAPVAR